MTVQKSEDDLYVTGTDVRIDGTVDGDLIVNAQNVTINGEVRGSVWAAGATVTVNGRVLQSAHLAGSVLRVEKGASIGRALLWLTAHSASTVNFMPIIVAHTDATVGCAAPESSGVAVGSEPRTVTPS